MICSQRLDFTAKKNVNYDNLLEQDRQSQCTFKSTIVLATYSLTFRCVRVKYNIQSLRIEPFPRIQS